MSLDSLCCFFCYKAFGLLLSPEACSSLKGATGKMEMYPWKSRNLLLLTHGEKMIHGAGVLATFARPRPQQMQGSTKKPVSDHKLVFGWLAEAVSWRRRRVLGNITQRKFTHNAWLWIRLCVCSTGESVCHLTLGEEWPRLISQWGHPLRVSWSKERV